MTILTFNQNDIINADKGINFPSLENEFREAFPQITTISFSVDLEAVAIDISPDLSSEQQIVASTVFINHNGQYVYKLTNKASTHQELESFFSIYKNELQIQKAPSVKGEMREINYFLSAPINEYGLPTYTDLAVKELNAWNYYINTNTVPKTVYPLIRTTIFNFYLTSGQIGHTRTTTKTYDLGFIADINTAVEQRHKNILAEATQYLSGILSITELGYILITYSQEMNYYEKGIGSPLVAAINGSVLPFITAEMKIALCGTVEDPTLGILNY